MSDMDLLCCENQAEVQVLSTEDGVLVGDDRVLKNLLVSESNCVVIESYFQGVQDEVTQEMRRILTTWMAEVCEDQCCEDVVFPLSTVLLDRMLGCVRIRKSQLQLLGSVCLLLASKLRQCRSLGGELLCFYTDNSITLEDLICWEMLVLGKLGWNISAVTPNDFLSPLIARIPACVKDTATTMIRQHAQIFISLCCTEFEFSLHKPSLVAASSLCVAASGLRLKQKFVDTMMTCTMQHLTGHRTEEITNCIVQIEEFFSSRLTLMSVHQTTGIGNQKRTTASSSSYIGNKSTSGLQQDDLSQPETPTDVQDIHF